MPTDDGYEYLLGIKDEVSGPARAARSGLDEVTSALKRSDAALRSHAEAQHAAAHGAIEHGKALQGVGLGFVKGLFNVGGLTAAIAEGQLLADALEKAGEIAREGIKFAIEASEFKENVTDAYSVVLGSAEEGERAFRALDKTAREIHMPAEKAHEIAQTLMLEGLKNQEAITDTIRAIGDLQRVGLGAGAEKLQSIVARSLAAGHLELGRGPKALAGTGLSFDALAADFGMSRVKFQAELKAGHIDVQQGIETIDKEIIKGKVGALATKKFAISDAFVDMKNSIRGVFQESDSSPLVDAFRRVSESMSEGTESGERMRVALDEIISGTAKVIDFASEVGTAFARAADETRDAWDATFDFLTRNNPLLSEQQKHDALIHRQIDKVTRARDELVHKQDLGIEAVDDASRRGAKPEELHKIAQKYDLGLAAGAPEVNKLLDQRQRSIDAFDEQERFIPHARESISSTRETGKEAGEALHEGAKEGLDAHSPSRKMYDLGLDAADGFKAGAATASDRDDAPSPHAMHVEVHVGGISLHGIEHAEDFLPLLESQIADVFERVALEMGA